MDEVDLASPRSGSACSVRIRARSWPKSWPSCGDLATNGSSLLGGLVALTVLKQCRSNGPSLSICGLGFHAGRSRAAVAVGSSLMAAKIAVPGLCGSLQQVDPPG